MIRWRHVQTSSDAKWGVLVYLAGPGVDADKDGIGDLDEALCASLPGIGIVATTDSGYMAVTQDIVSGLKMCGAKELGALVGFSAGCQGVRAHLWKGIEPPAVVVLDGTSAAWPKPDQAQLDVWSQQAAMAQRSQKTVVMTCTLQRYTERLPKPFAATSTVISRALGWDALASLRPLAMAPAVYPGAPLLELHDGDLHALAYGGTDCDARAHAAQLVTVLPDVLARYVAPRLGVDSPGVGELARMALAGVGSWLAMVGRHLLDRAQDGSAGHLQRAMAEVGVQETPGPASTTRIDQYLSVCIRNGKLLGLRGDDQFSWCAAFASWCGLPDGMTPRAAVAELVSDARALGLWRDGSVWRDPQPGDLAIYARAGQDPRTGGSGHVNRVVQKLGGGMMRTVGGNEQDAVRLSERHLSEPVGWVVYPDK